MTENGKASLLVLDASYTLEMIKERGMENSVTCRDLDGFFRHVWSVHPFASLLTSESWSPRFGKPVWHDMGPRHTFIEGKVGRFSWLSFLFPVNFLIGQIGLFLSLWALIKREDIRVIRVGDPLYLGLFGLALKAVTGVPMLIRINGNNDKVRENTGRAMYPRFFRTAAVEKKVERFVLPRADMIAAPNQDNVDFAVASGANPEFTTIFRYGNLLAPEHLQLPAERARTKLCSNDWGLNQGKFLLCIGRLEPVKFPDDAVRILSAAIKAGHDVKLFFAGDGDMRADLLALGKELGVGDRIVFGGNQNQKSLSQLNAHTACVISPLTGRALSEAALGGAPIAAYDLDWQSDLVETGRTGELVLFRDVDAFGAAVCRLLTDKDYARKMGMGARERAREMLDPEVLDAHERAEYPS
ncbi:MAG: glycosyltransferase [Sphingomonadales bacterium]|nr:glycosyltransferase [Sphingomonadales bacterium]